MDPADYILEWAAHSAKFNNVEPVTDDEGNVTNQAEIDAGVYFDAGSPGIMLIEETPEIDGNTISLTWSVPFADWEVAMTAPTLPAHVVAQRALDIEDPEEAKQAVVDAVTNEDTEALAALSQVWNTDFNYTDFPEDEGLRLSNGAVHHDGHGRGPVRHAEGATPSTRATVRRASRPSPSAGTATRWARPRRCRTVRSTSSARRPPRTCSPPSRTWRASRSSAPTRAPTSTSTCSSPTAARSTRRPTAATRTRPKAVRQAFLKTIPRQQIVENLIQPLNPNAEVRNSYTVVPGSPFYDTITSENGMADQYGEPDIAGAAQLLSGAGVTTPVAVRLLFDPNNPRRQNEYELIAASAAEAGFTVTPYQVQTDWGTDLSNATSFYDAALFGWQSESTAVTESDANYSTGGLNNFYGYSNPQVDALFDELQTETDEERQEAILADIEAILVEDAFGVTIFQFPGVTAWNPENITNISKLSINPTIFYGFWDWEPGTAAAAQ